MLGKPEGVGARAIGRQLARPLNVHEIAHVTGADGETPAGGDQCQCGLCTDPNSTISAFGNYID